MLSLMCFGTGSGEVIDAGQRKARSMRSLYNGLAVCGGDRAVWPGLGRRVARRADGRDHRYERKGVHRLHEVGVEARTLRSVSPTRPPVAGHGQENRRVAAEAL